MFYFDPMYFVFALPALLLAFYAQAKVQSAFNKYSQMPNRRNLTGQEAARYLLSAGQLSVSVEGCAGAAFRSL